MTSPPAGELSYHLGLAFDRMGDEVKAKQWYQRADSLNYHPTYELVLTARTRPQKLMVR